MVVTIVSVVIRNSTQKNSELRVRPRKPAVPLSIIVIPKLSYQLRKVASYRTEVLLCDNSDHSGLSSCLFE